LNLAKKILIGIAIILLLLAGTLTVGNYMSTISRSDTQNIVIDTGIACNVDIDCTSNSELPSHSYCLQKSCRFTDTEKLVGEVYESLA